MRFHGFNGARTDAARRLSLHASDRYPRTIGGKAGGPTSGCRDDFLPGARDRQECDGVSRGGKSGGRGGIGVMANQNLGVLRLLGPATAGRPRNFTALMEPYGASG